MGTVLIVWRVKIRSVLYALLPGEPGLHFTEEHIFKLFRLEDLDMWQPDLKGVLDFVETAYLE
ncbi:MAG: hypothetical protein NTY86_06025 [Deltaproteobacteria bacterium]|nr:hypothetical protein [Deltaproteobacteria bacterium]